MSDDWATTDGPKKAALEVADKITALAAQHTWLVAANSTLKEKVARLEAELAEANREPEYVGQAGFCPECGAPDR